VQTLVVDLLPAGFEIETATVSKGRSTTDYSWLPDLTEATYTEERDDRFVGALDMKEGTRDFTLAYIARATTAGEVGYGVGTGPSPSERPRSPPRRFRPFGVRAQSAQSDQTGP
jgi:hypothetical protein